MGWLLGEILEGVVCFIKRLLDYLVDLASPLRLLLQLHDRHSLLDGALVHPLLHPVGGHLSLKRLSFHKNFWFFTILLLSFRLTWVSDFWKL